MHGSARADWSPPLPDDGQSAQKTDKECRLLEKTDSKSKGIRHSLHRGSKADTCDGKGGRGPDLASLIEARWHKAQLGGF